jgi:transcriptional regulator with GAF, ATPase, and Fis domain
MNELAEIDAGAAETTNRGKIVNLSFYTQTPSSRGDRYEKLPVSMTESSGRRDVAALTEAANAIAPMAMFGTIRRGSDNRVVMRYWRPNGFGAHRFDESELPEMLMPEASGLLQSSSDEIRTPATAALDSIHEFMGIGRIVTIPSHHSPSVRFWMGLRDAGAVDEERLQRLADLGELGSSILIGSDASASERERLQRLEGAAELLPELFSVLDIRKVFGRVSEIARKVLPHDIVGLGMYSDDLSEMTLYACSCYMPVGEPVVVRNEYPVVSTRVWDHHVHHDLSADAVERDTDACRAGYRSSLRIPIRFGERLIGGLNFMTYEPAKYTPLDVNVARRISEYVSLALSHHRMAEESRRTEALRERAANLQMLDGLLKTLTGVLDVREVFDRVSDIAQKVLKHDAISIAELIDNDERVRLYASRGLSDSPQPYEIPVPNRKLVTQPWDFVLVDDVLADPDYAQSPGTLAGMRSVLFVPIRVDGRLRVSLNFYAREVGRFVREDVLVAQRIADHVALAMSHQRLLEEARLADELRLRTSNVEMLDHLLAELTDSGELSEVIGRISTIAQKVLPHDAMLVPVVLPGGTHVRVVAGALPGGATYPETAEIPPHLRNSGWDYDIIDDALGDPIQRNLPSAKLGLRSSLRVAIRFDGKLAAAVVFLSFTPGFYQQKDVLIARRIADQLALGLSRDSRQEANQRADAANERASRLESRIKALTEELDARTGYRHVVGDSYAWREVLTQATQVAPTDTTALLLGESGTGKEVVARFVHRASSRRDGPFVAINCAALPEQLLEAELFGYERGAFTGATQSKPGQLELAAGGTLFLDEVAEMSPSAQAKFLRVLQEREFQRLGGTRVLRTDARIIAATNRNLLQSIERGHFREDLYYRLNVFAIHLPPLRDRREDILGLSEAFLGEISKGLGRPPAGISREARARLLDYHWPGNVRELRNVLERAAILCDGGLILAEHLALSIQPSLPVQLPRPVVPSLPVVHVPEPLPATPVIAARSANDIRSIERTMIEKALQDSRFNKSKAAAILGLTRAQLYGRMRRYGLD